MKHNNSKTSVPLFAILGFVLAIIGSQAAWINLPLSGSAPKLVAGMSSHAAMINLFRSMFLITILLAGICSVFRFRLLSIQFIFVGLLIIVSYVVYGLLQDHHLVVSYMNQSEGRELLQRFIVKHYWPNINPDHTVSLITDYEYLWQRLILNWNIIGVGCKAAFLGGLILLFGSVTNVRLSIPTFIPIAIFFVTTLVVLTPVIRADNIHYQADVLLKSGQHRQALTKYEAAFRLDPMLGYSAPFLRKVSRAYYRLEGEHSRFAVLYLQHIAALSIDVQNPARALLDKINHAHLLVNNNRLQSAKVTALQQAVLTQSYKEDVDAWVTQGLVEHEQGLQIKSLGSFREALKRDGSRAHVNYFIAHVLLELQKHNDSLAYLKSALLSVWTKQLRADLLCTIGEVHQQSDQPLLARQAYTACHELDSIYNYRAVMLLSGT